MFDLLILIFGLTLLAVLGYLYFLPIILAKSRQHPSLAALAAVNVLLGWTLLGWVAALAWALAYPGYFKPDAGKGFGRIVRTRFV